MLYEYERETKKKTERLKVEIKLFFGNLLFHLAIAAQPPPPLGKARSAIMNEQKHGERNSRKKVFTRKELFLIFEIQIGFLAILISTR